MIDALKLYVVWTVQIWAQARAPIHDPKVACITNGDTASFFIPQPLPQQPPATTSPTHNLHHHKHPRLPINHNNRPTTTLDHHTPTSPVSTTTSAPSTSPTPRHAMPSSPQATPATGNASTAQTTTTREEGHERQTTASPQQATSTP